MRLGILADIHEGVEPLREALVCLDSLRVDQIVFLGDLVETAERLEETVSLLAGRGIVGVWGNHDIGLSYEPSEYLLQRYPASVMQFMTSLHPRLDLAGCSFTHVEPWLDPCDPQQIWHYEGAPDNPEAVQKSFNACSQRVIFCGHFHRWMVADRNGARPWAGEGPIVLSPPERYLVLVAPLRRGYFATFDTDTGELRPHRVSSG